MTTHCEWQGCRYGVLLVFQFCAGEGVISLCWGHGYDLLDVYPEGVLTPLKPNLVAA